MAQRVRLYVLKDEEEHDIPDGWIVLHAVPLRTTGANATVGLVLQEIVTRRRMLPSEYADGAFEQEQRA